MGIPRFPEGRGKAFPGFHIEMETPVESFIEEKGRVVGVRLKGGSESAPRLRSPPMGVTPSLAGCFR